MGLTYWDTHPQMKTSAALLADNFPEHYEKLKTYFSNTDIILDVGCGTNIFSNYIPNATGVDEKTDLITYDLSKYNTLHFSESIGYIGHDVLTRLITDSNIKKVVIKDYLTDKNPEGVEEYFSYEFGTLNNFILPLLKRSGYTVKVEEFFPSIKKFIELMDKIGLGYIGKGKLFFVKSWNPLVLTMKPVVVTAIKKLV